MQRISCLAAAAASAPELGPILAACRPGVCGWRRRQEGRGPSRALLQLQPAPERQWAAWLARPPGQSGLQGRGLSRRRVAFVGQNHRGFGSRAGTEGPPGSSGGSSGGQQPDISVVGIPDPLTWIRCKVVMFLVGLYFEVDMNSGEFERGVKQALLYVSDVMSRGRYHELRGIISHEMCDYVEEKCSPLTGAQRRHLAVKPDDIIFMLPEDVAVVFDQRGRTFCSTVMRFYFLSSHEGPDDPEGARIFKVAPSEDGGPQKKLATAVYEFHRELTRGASPDWKVTMVWHWHWTPPE